MKVCMKRVSLPESHRDLLDGDACVALIDQLTQLYMHRSNARFFGESVPAELQTTYVPVKIKIAPTSIRVEG